MKCEKYEENQVIGGGKTKELEPMTTGSPQLMTVIKP